MAIERPTPCRMRGGPFRLAGLRKKLFAARDSDLVSQTKPTAVANRRTPYAPGDPPLVTSESSPGRTAIRGAVEIPTAMVTRAQHSHSVAYPNPHANPTESTNLNIGATVARYRKLAHATTSSDRSEWPVSGAQRWATGRGPSVPVIRPHQDVVRAHRAENTKRRGGGGKQAGNARVTMSPIAVAFSVRPAEHRVSYCRKPRCASAA